MDFKQLRYFVTVAEELSFSKAAARLHMSQPPLSQQIKALEEEMGVALFLRNRREVRLTDAGVIFLRESRSLLDQFRTAVNATVHASRANVGTLRVGVATSGLFSVMPTLQQLLRADFPNVEVLVSDMQSDDQVVAVAQGALDLGIVHVRPDRLNLARQQVLSETLSIVLSKDHPRASDESLALAELADEPMVGLSRPHAPIVFDAVIAACANAAFSPKIRHTARSPFTIFQMVRMGFGFALVPQSYRNATYPGIVFRSLPPTAVDLVRLELIWSERQGAALAGQVARALAPKLQAALAQRV